MSTGFSVKCFTLLSAVLIFSAPAMAVSSWFWQHPYPTGSHINGIQFIDDDNGWIVTSLGAVLGTNDGGNSWEELYRIPSGLVSLNCVFFENTYEGWACGNNGTLLHTVDGGDNWISSNPVTTHLLSIEFIDSNYGTIVGASGVILRTMNGGSSWQLQGSGIVYPIFDVSFISPAIGWATGTTGKILNTLTAGAFWQELSTGISANYAGIHFFDEFHGFAAGEGYIAYTSDGITWSVALYEAGAAFSDIDFNGLLGAAPGMAAVAVTENEGGSWNYETMPDHPLWPLEPGLNCVTVPSESEVLASGDYGIIYSRQPSGSWNQSSSHETLADLCGIMHFDPYRVWSCGEGGIIMKSSDGGVNWESQVTDADYSLRDICFPTSLIGYCVGASSNGAVILKSVDSGSNWAEVTPSVPQNSWFQSVDFFNEDCGVATGSYGMIRYTTDGGASWIEKAGFGTNSFSRVSFGNTDRGWIVGEGGRIVCFDFNSDSWSEQSSEMTQPLHGLFVLNADTAWAVGWEGTVLRTLDAGGFWETVHGTNGNTYNDVWFADNGMDGYLTGYNGESFGVTDDGGFTITHWGPYSPMRNQLSEISFIDADNGWGCGDYGRILRFGEDPTGIADFSHSLSPAPGTGLAVSSNPFITSSTASFTLPAQCSVNLDLYDLSGRKVQTILSGILPRGEHSMMVSGEGLAPGMYFIKLTAGGISETRTMVRIP